MSYKKVAEHYKVKAVEGKRSIAHCTYSTLKRSGLIWAAE